MLHKHINIELLIDIQTFFEKGIKAYICAKQLKVGKDRVYGYYSLLEKGLSVFEILEIYKENKKKCGRKKIFYL